MEKTKLGIFAENLDGGGVEKILQTILCHFNYDRYEVTLFTVRHETLPSALTGLPIKTGYVFDTYEGDAPHKLITNALNKIKLLVYYHCSPSLFYKLFVRKKFDVAIAFIEGYATRIVSGASDTVKRIAWLHTELITNHWTDVAFRSREEEHRCYKRFCKVICVSNEVKRQVDELYDLSSRTMVIYNPVDTKRIIKLSQEMIQDKPGLKGGNKLIVSLGRLEKEKGYDRLIRIANRLQKEGFRFDLWILGKGSLHDALASMATEAGPVRLIGYKVNPYPYIKMCDFYVCSSLAEGYNTAVTEALVLGKPVVSTDCSGARELLGDSEYGIVTLNDEYSLYEGIKKMLSTEVLSHYGTMAVARGNSFSLEGSLNSIYNLIDG